MCLETECNGLDAWSKDDGYKTGEEAATWLIEHRTATHDPDAPSIGEQALKEAGSFSKMPRYLYRPADTDPGAP